MGSVICPKCGTKNSDMLDDCIFCGYHLKDSIGHVHDENKELTKADFITKNNKVENEIKNVNSDNKKPFDQTTLVAKAFIIIFLIFFFLMFLISMLFFIGI